MEVKKISEGHFDTDGRFTVKKKFGNIAVSELEAFAKETKDFFLKFELTETEEQCAFFFDGSVAQRTTLGYSASHSSRHTSVDRITLVRRGEDGAPAKGASIRFKQHEMYPSFD